MRAYKQPPSPPMSLCHTYQVPVYAFFVYVQCTKSLILQRIENLDGLVQLENLSLSHNVIEKIENLGHLKSLRVLNLSYNMIERIENMSSLTV